MSAPAVAIDHVQGMPGGMQKPVLRYPGSKWRLAPWIVSLLPPHDCYVEPFFGSGAVLFTKPPSRVEIANDLSGDVVTFFRCLRERPADLIGAIELTPYALDEYRLACDEREPVDEIERARRFFVRVWMSYGGKLGGRSGWRAGWDGPSGRQQSAAVTWRAIPERLRPAVDRLRDVLIENRPAVDVVRLYDRPSTVIYADPPYVTGTLVAGDGRDGAQAWARYYEHTMGDAEHLELLDALDRHRGPVLLSGYRSELYDGRLPHWTRLDRNARAFRNAQRVESLWLNPVAAATARQRPLWESGVPG